MAFNPAVYSLTPTQAAEKMDKRLAFEAENNHLALPFFVENLQEIVPAQYPGDTAIVLADSGTGKSTILKSWAAICETQVSKQARRAVTAFISHEDTSEISAEQQIERYGNRMKFESSQMLYIGRSFGMSRDDIADLHMTNTLLILDYAQQVQFADAMPFSGIFLDYIQRIPGDPGRRNDTAEGRRFQIADDVKRICNAAVTYSCPIVAGSQAGIKSLNSAYHTDMPIPGKGDTDEAKEVYQIPNRVYSFWKVTEKYAPGTQVECGKWNFKADVNLWFMWCKKFRYYQPQKGKPRYAPTNCIFPIRIDDSGNFFYDAKYHQSIYFGV